MSKYLILIVFVFFSGIHIYAQENINMIEILKIKKDMHSLEKRISKLIKKNPDIAKTKDLKQFHILELGIKDDTKLKKEDYISYSFLFHLYPLRVDRYVSKFRYKYRYRESVYYKKVPWISKRENCIATNTIITDSKGDLVAYGNALRITPTPPVYCDSSDIILARMFFDKELDFAFCIVSPKRHYDIGVKGNNLYVFGWEGTIFDEVFLDWEFVKYTWEEFMDCCFDNWVISKKRNGKK